MRRREANQDRLPRPALFGVRAVKCQVNNLALNRPDPYGSGMRLDQWLVENAFFDSREKARQEILAGRVRQKPSGIVMDKPGQKVPKNLEVEIEAKARFVSRAGDKLEGLLENHPIEFRDRWVLDVGSSTGGFTDCVLQRGAAGVYDVDVGTHQLHEKIRNDSRVKIFEETDIREIDLSQLQPPPDYVLIDVAFISIRLFIRKLLNQFPQATFIILFKPQFESGREIPKKKGIVADEDRMEAQKEMLQFLEGLGFNATIVEDSKLKGTKGNQESFIVGQLQIPAHVFRTYDIRGHAETDLKCDVIERIGVVLARKVIADAQSRLILRRPRVGIGRDARLSSDRILATLAKGLSRYPVDLINLGSLPTPVVYFANHRLDLDACFQITASHNPGEDNGLKMMIGQNTLFGEAIQGIGDEAAELMLADSPVDVKFVENWNGELKREYLKFLHDQFTFKRKFKLVVDTGNGMAGALVREVLTPYCSEIEILYEGIDCSFPHHPADPTVAENLKDLRNTVKERGAELGLAYDGDGDRVGLVSSSGRIFWGDEILMLLAEKVLRDQPGAVIIGEVKCSEKLFQMIQSRGGKSEMYKTGHSLIKKRMKEVGAAIAGEMSGHLFFADRYFGFDDALYASLRILEVIDEFNIDLDRWIEQFPSGVSTPEIRMECTREEKAWLVNKVIEYFRQEPEVRINSIDGVRVSFEDGAWLLVRASNTQEVVVIRIEAPDQSRLDSLKSELSKIISKEIPYV
ncbi:MAG: hypothetical protein COV44_09340 [Deltaproteobacteria bacterium CG11_big_fil_rev_8_21_14_0_20_45_16]|nr:MAG: hypothetical protein COV44_09340 [Deltaproteobacteria bacterium CG11_big_fil_rev_8_21_14_0_20_45_16]